MAPLEGAEGGFMMISPEEMEAHEQRGAAHRAVRDLMAYVKTFTDDDWETIYAEREWRSLKPYTFQPENVAEVVLPAAFRNQLIAETSSIDPAKVVTWETLAGQSP
jgi:hypothetical protein